ncbi:MAG TPA: hypothetical protein VEH62_12700 [Gemmatimonadales bacterium]|nr:hypothetical protein [Gemmatimonadales bacterium]
MSPRRVLPAVLVLLVGVAGSAKSRLPDQRDFWALNNTGKEVREFYVSPHDNTQWGSDVLGRNTLPNGMGTIITFSGKVQTGCVMDFKLVFTDDTNDTYTNGRNVCNLEAIVFTSGESYGLTRP